MDGGAGVAGRVAEVITLSVFGMFSVFYFGDKLHWNHAAAFGCLVAGGAVHVSQVLKFGKGNSVLIADGDHFVGFGRFA